MSSSWEIQFGFCSCLVLFSLIVFFCFMWVWVILMWSTLDTVPFPPAPSDLVSSIRGRPAATIGLAPFRIGPKDHFFDILKPQTHVSLVKCTQPWSFNWSSGNFNWSAHPFQIVAIGPYRPIDPRAPTYGVKVFCFVFVFWFYSRFRNLLAVVLKIASNFLSRYIPISSISIIKFTLGTSVSCFAAYTTAY